MSLSKRVLRSSDDLLSEDYFGYDFRELLFIFALSVALTAGVYFGLPPLLETFGAADLFLVAMLYERTFIQWCTVAAFAFGLLIVLDRGLTCLALERSVGRLRAVDRSTRELAGPVGSRFRRVAQAIDEQGALSGARLNSELFERETGQLERVHGLLRDATQLMLGLGFFGTVLGISRLFTSSFAEGSEGLAGFARFTGGLSTALDTSVVAICLSLILTLIATAVGWTEVNLLQVIDRTVRSRLGIEDTTASASATEAGAT